MPANQQGARTVKIEVRPYPGETLAHAFERALKAACHGHVDIKPGKYRVTIQRVDR